LGKLFWCLKSIPLNIKKLKNILIGESDDWTPAKYCPEMMLPEQSDKVHVTVDNVDLDGG
jgi:hypothetical protein